MPFKFNPFTGKLDIASGGPVFNDSKFRVFDNGDASKKVALELSGVSPSTTRVLDIQDVDGPIAVGYGLANQYIRGDATISNFPVAAGGGNSVSYYFNGSVSQGTILGNPYYEINKTPANAVQTNFTINAGNTTAYFITDAGDPALLAIPQGNFTFQLYALTSSGSPQLSVELYKYDGAAFTQIGVTSPAATISNTTSDIHFLTVFVPASTTLALTDRLAVRVIGSSLGGHTITFNTEGNTQSQIITTLSSGMAALNGLSDQIQFLATGTTGTDFNIVSSAATHNFNIPTASAANRGALSSADWTAFNGKIGAGLYTATTGLTMNTARLLGRTTAGVGAAEEISVGTGLSLTAGVLSNTAAGVSSVTATAPITSSGGATPVISTSIATNKIVGRSTAGTGVMEELTPVGITVSAGNITGIGGTLGTVDNAVPRADGTGQYTAQGSDIVIDDATTSTQANVAITNQHSGQTNSALVLSPKGTGAFILGPKPDGTTTGGNARGSKAICLVGDRSAATQVASGANSVAIGYRATASGTQNIAISGTASGSSNSIAIGGSAGFYATSIGGNASATGAIAIGSDSGGATASGLNSICIGRDGSNAANQTRAILIGGANSSSTGTGSILIGWSQTISGDDAAIIGGTGNGATSSGCGVLSGFNALANRRAMQAHAAGQFAAQGDAQRARFVLRNKTTTNSAVELFLDGSSTRLTIPSGKVLGLTINISGVKSDGSAVAHYLRQYCLKNVSGTCTEVYAPVTIGTDNAAGTSIALSAYDVGVVEALKVEVTGTTSEIWRWVASVDAVEIAYGI
jgi:hypothetical protein